MLTHAISGALKSTIVRLVSTVAGDYGAEPTAVSGPGGNRLKATPAVAKAAAQAAVPYPREFERIVTLPDGATVRIRPIRADDETRLVALFGRLSPHTVYQRFFTTHRRLPAAWYREFANVDYVSRLALVAEHADGDGIAIVAVARWEPAETPGTVEIALLVEDAWQSHGVGAILFHDLLAAAAARGVHGFRADVLAENHRMLGLLRRHAVITRSRVAEGVVEVEFAGRNAGAPTTGAA